MAELRSPANQNADLSEPASLPWVECRFVSERFRPTFRFRHSCLKREIPRAPSAAQTVAAAYLVDRLRPTGMRAVFALARCRPGLGLDGFSVGAFGLDPAPGYAKKCYCRAESKEARLARKDAERKVGRAASDAMRSLRLSAWPQAATSNERSSRTAASRAPAAHQRRASAARGADK